MKSKISMDQKRRKLVQVYLQSRLQLKAELQKKELQFSEKQKISFQLQNLPRNSSITRIKNRCSLTGRARSVLRLFKLSRLEFRRKALQGLIPGLKKASWLF
jgi:small subunit ribosomal protein S14